MRYALLEARETRSDKRLTCLIAEDNFNADEDIDQHFVAGTTKDHRLVGYVEIDGDDDVIESLHESYESD